MNVHVKITAYLFIAYGVLGLLAGLAILLATTLGGRLPEDPDAQSFVRGVGTFLASVAVLSGLLGFIGGLGLLYRQEWARVFALFVSVLMLFNVPIGTALGIYTIWALMFNRDVLRSFEQRSAGGPPEMT